MPIHATSSPWAAHRRAGTGARGGQPAFAAGLAAALLALLCAAPVAAEPVVLAVEGDRLYVELGARDGVGAGAELELLHEVVARDPRTGIVLRDHFALGTLTIERSGEKVSIARGAPEVAGRALAGDRVRLLSAPRRYLDPWQAQVDRERGAAAPAPAPTAAPTPAATPASKAPAVDHLALADRAWRDTLGQPLEQRVARWHQLLADDPSTPLRGAVEAEIRELTNQRALRESALARARAGAEAGRAPHLARLAAELGGGDAPLTAAPVPRAVPGAPLELAFLIRDPSAVVQAWLFVRPTGEPGFRRHDLVRDGDVYLRGAIDAAQVRAPKIEWYVEAELRQPNGAPQIAPVIGSQDRPRVTEIDEVVEELPIATGRSHVDAHIDFVDFDGKLGDGYDQYYQAEIDFAYRFLDPVYAVRLGFGSLSGTGGPKDVIDEDPSNKCLDAFGEYRCRKVTFSYVYTEFELRLRPQVAVLLRPQAGLLTTDSVADTDPGRCATGVELEGCGFRTRFGGRVRLRFGDERGTNLAIGAGFTNGVGTLLEAAYQWLPTAVLPVQLVVQVTDMPVPENLGVRLIADVGWRRLSWFYPSARVSYQARDIDHAGFSGGLALNFDW